MGRISPWKSGETTAIRIPKQFEALILDYAHELDALFVQNIDAVPDNYQVGGLVRHKDFAFYGEGIIEYLTPWTVYVRWPGVTPANICSATAYGRRLSTSYLIPIQKEAADED